MKKALTGGLVYSTDSGRMCPACRQPLDADALTTLPAEAAAPPDGLIPYLQRTCDDSQALGYGRP